MAPRCEVVSWYEDVDAEEARQTALRATSAALARFFAADDPAWLTVMITDDDHIRALNSQFMDDDSVTDVLAFNEDAGWQEGEPPRPADGAEFGARGDRARLGDLAVSLPQVKRQAAAAGKSWRAELAMLVAHGVLHLLGYDHENPRDAATMFGLTDAIIGDLES